MGLELSVGDVVGEAVGIDDLVGAELGMKLGASLEELGKELG